MDVISVPETVVGPAGERWRRNQDPWNVREQDRSKVGNGRVEERDGLRLAKDPWRMVWEGGDGSLVVSVPKASLASPPRWTRSTSPHTLKRAHLPCGTCPSSSCRCSKVEADPRELICALCCKGPLLVGPLTPLARRGSLTRTYSSELGSALLRSKAEAKFCC